MNRPTIETWAALSTPIYRVLTDDVDGDLHWVAGAEERAAGNRWIYVDDVDGVAYLDDATVSSWDAAGRLEAVTDPPTDDLAPTGDDR